MLNLHIYFSFFALAIVAGVILLRTMHARRVALHREKAMPAKTLQVFAELRARKLR